MTTMIGRFTKSLRLRRRLLMITMNLLIAYRDVLSCTTRECEPEVDEEGDRIPIHIDSVLKYHNDKEQQSKKNEIMSAGSSKTTKRKRRRG